MSDFDRISDVIRYLDEHHTEQPSLDELAAHVDLSPFHFHRLFSRWAGITPKEFLQCLTLSHAKQVLRAGTSVLDAALDAGLSGPGPLHDLCVKLEAASPGEVKAKGSSWTIKAGFGETPFGTCLVGQNPRGICHLSFLEAKDRNLGSGRIEADWPRARIEWDHDMARCLVDQVFAKPSSSHRDSPLCVYVQGTKFQVRVWRALLTIPSGALVSYGRIAKAIGDGGAARAVGSAVGQNRLAYLIPCHRVIRETGIFGEYRWGTARKQAMVAWEGASRLDE